MCKRKSSYYLDFGSLCSPQYVHTKSWKELKNLVKKSIDENRSFDIYLRNQVIPKKSSIFCPFDIDKEFAGYDCSKDTCYSYNLRDDIYKKRLLRLKRKIWPILKTYGVQPK